MKYLKSYNESLRDKMTPKSEDEIEYAIEKMNSIDILKLIWRERLDKTYTPTDDKIREDIKSVDAFEIIKIIKEGILDEKFMPSKEEISNSMSDPNIIFKSTKKMGWWIINRICLCIL